MSSGKVQMAISHSACLDVSAGQKCPRRKIFI